MAAITLREVTRENWRAALELSVRPDQQRFIADYSPVTAIALAKAYVHAEGMVWLPYGIYADDRLVGFFELAYQPGNPDQCWIYHFFIDQREQGKGYGKAALHTVIHSVKECHPACRSIRLIVHPDNVSAQRLYLGAGFQATGEEMYGEPVYALALDSIK
jgi:diamine N-acetyltransferase